MAATRDDIAGWFDEAKRAGNTHMIVVCDTWDHEDYPIQCKGAEDCLKQYDLHNGKNMQRVMEIYDLSLDKDAQMNAARVFHLPPRPAVA